MKIRLAVLAAAFLAAPAFAETEADRQAIAAGMDGLIEAVKAGEYGQTLTVLPPKMLAVLAENAGVSVDDMRSAADAAGTAMMEQVTFDSFGYSLDGARFDKTAEREYALIPTTSEMTVMDSKIKTTGETLAMVDDGKWYLLRVETPDQMQQLVTAYPDMEGVEVKDPVIETTE